MSVLFPIFGESSMPAAPATSASAAQDSTPERRFTSELLLTVARGASCQSLLSAEKPHPHAHSGAPQAHVKPVLRSIRS